MVTVISNSLLMRSFHRREYCLVTADEWLMLSGFLPYDQEIKLTNQLTESGDTRNILTISPGY